MQVVARTLIKPRSRRFTGEVSARGQSGAERASLAVGVLLQTSLTGAPNPPVSMNPPTIMEVDAQPSATVSRRPTAETHATHTDEVSAQPSTVTGSTSGGMDLEVAPTASGAGHAAVAADDVGSATASPSADLQSQISLLTAGPSPGVSAAEHAAEEKRRVSKELMTVAADAAMGAALVAAATASDAPTTHGPASAVMPLAATHLGHLEDNDHLSLEAQHGTGTTRTSRNSSWSEAR